MVDVRPYIDASGRDRFTSWFEDLPETVQARIVTTLERLEDGKFSAMKGIWTGCR
jgi:putative component of toxin-antitoxin plasmid stabilization module